MLNRETSSMKLGFSKDPIFVFDTNAFKYRYKKTERKVVVMESCLGELFRNSEVFPDESVLELSLMLNPDVINQFVSESNEKLILETCRKYAKGDYAKQFGLGWADNQILSYALEQSRKGNYVAIVSNDANINRVVKGFIETAPELKGRITALSARRYLIQANSQRLKGLDKGFREAIAKEMEEQYRVAG